MESPPDKPGVLAGRSIRTILWSTLFVLHVVAFVGCSALGTDEPSGANSGSFPGVDEDARIGSEVRKIATPPEFVAEQANQFGATTPSKAPTQVSSRLAGSALPTNQWWTSALVGPGSEQMWAFPLVADVGADAVSIGRPLVEAEPNVIRSTVVEAVRVSGSAGVGTGFAQTTTEVTGYGAFSVHVAVDFGNGSAIELTLAQGSPATWIRVLSGRVSLNPGPGYLVEQLGDTTWQLSGPHGHVWSLDGPVTDIDRSQLIADEGTVITLIARPDGVDAEWSEAERTLVGNPVTNTTSTMRVDDDGTVTHELIWHRRSAGPTAVALLPHHAAHAGAVETIAGNYPTARGSMSLALTDRLTLRYQVDRFIPGVPALLDDAARDRVAAIVDVEPIGPTGSGGSYWDAKALGRLATVAEVADAVERPEASAAAREIITARLRDWFSNDGPNDQRLLAYDPTWGGVIANPAEFGNEDYNDHHFHYGYLIQAAATIAEGDAQFLADFGPIVDRLVDDLMGAESAAFPPQRVFNPYLGHSLASGFAPFADGNNQESSSESVHAWWAVTRWGLVRDDDAMVERGLAHYAVEADSARRYWLGVGLDRPPGYAHQAAGIVWDAKIDFATFFDGSAGSVIGIQLLPFSFGSLYRSDSAAAAQRYTEVAQTGVTPGGVVTRWPDLFLMDVALADPASALDRFRANPTLDIEAGNSRSLLAYWLETLASLGPPDDTVSVSSPFGAAFSGPAGTTFAGHNPTGDPVTVTFRRDGRPIAELEIDPGTTATASAER